MIALVYVQTSSVTVAPSVPQMEPSECGDHNEEDKAEMERDAPEVQND